MNDVGATAAVSDAGRDLFLAGVERALQPLDDPAEIMATVARLVGERLSCDRCAYAEAEPDEDHFTMTGSYARGLPPLTGRMAMSDFSAETLRCMRAGEPYVVADAFADARVLPSSATSTGGPGSPPSSACRCTRAAGSSPRWPCTTPRRACGPLRRSRC